MKFVKILVYAAIVLFVAACENASSLTEKGKQALAENKAGQAVEYFSKAVELKNAEAARLLGLLYADGNGVDKQPEKAVELYSSASEWGDSLATYLLAECYENGVGTKADLTKSVMLYEKCAQACPEAYGKLANLYFRGGDNFEVDWGKAYANSEKAASTKDSDALAINGYFLCHGTYGAVSDREKGEKELRESVANGSNLGKALLGMWLLGSPDKTKEGLSLVKEATEAGEPFGIAATGYGYELGYPRGSFATASKYYQQAAEKGCVWAMYRNGMCLTDLMMKRDAGHEWFRKAAAHGDGDGLNRQGYSYLNGFKEEKSPEKALELFKKGAEKGNAYAMANIGWCYEKGEGVEANKEKAIEWYEKAIKYGDTYFSQGRLKALK